jgi:hypothetical protein
MLDLARYQVANLANGGTLHQPLEVPEDCAAKSYSCATVADPLAVPLNIEISVNDTPVDTNTLPPVKRASEVSTDVSEIIDVLLENGDWTVNKAANAEDPAAHEVSDEGSEHLDFLLENDFWLDKDDEKEAEYVHTPVSQSQSVQIVSPVLSLKPRLQLPCNLSRKEKNRIHARNRRMKVKMEHDHLKRSVDAYTRCKFSMNTNNMICSVLILTPFVDSILNISEFCSQEEEQRARVDAAQGSQLCCRCYQRLPTLFHCLC